MILIFKIYIVVRFYFVDCDTLDDNGTKSYTRGMISNNSLIVYFCLIYLHVIFNLL